MFTKVNELKISNKRDSDEVSRILINNGYTINKRLGKIQIFEESQSQLASDGKNRCKNLFECNPEDIDLLLENR